MGTFLAKTRARIAPAAAWLGWPTTWGMSLGVATLGALYFAYGAELAAEPPVPEISFTGPKTPVEGWVIIQRRIVMPIGPEATPFPEESFAVWYPLIPEPTPIPTPTPPPPPPPRLADAIRDWTLESLDVSEAVVRDQRSGESFSLRVGSKPRRVDLERVSTLDIELIAVDLDSATATFRAAGQEEAIRF